MACATGRFGQTFGINILSPGPGGIVVPMVNAQPPELLMNPSHFTLLHRANLPIPPSVRAGSGK